MGVFSWLAAQFSRSQALAPIGIVEPPAIYFQHTRIGGSRSPEDVSAILREADNGRMWQFCDLANESRQKDCHLQAILGTREMAVTGLRWNVIAASDSAIDRKVADFTREWMANFGTGERVGDSDPGDLRTLFSHLAGGAYFGYATSETLFAKDGGYVIPVGCVPVQPRRFIFDLERGNLRFWDVQGSVPYPGTDLMATYPGRFVQYQPRINGDSEAREGLARVLMWAALFRNWGIADWLKLAEMAWKPWRIGTYAKSPLPGKALAASEDRIALKNALESLTTNGVAMLPDTVTLAVEWAKRSSGSSQSSHALLVDFFAKEMSKAVLGQTMTTEDGASLSQAQVHNEVRHDIRDSDGLSVAGVVRRHLIAPTVRLNFGRGVAIPNFTLVAPDAVDLTSFSVGVKNLADAGLAIPAGWVRERVAMPTPIAGEELVGGGVALSTTRKLAA